MKMNIVQQFLRALSIAVFCLFLSYSSSAQTNPVIYIENDTVVHGAEVSLDIQVADFTNILSNAFSIAWDTMSLRYVGIDNIALGMDEEDFNTQKVSEGKLGYLFFDFTSSEPVALDDESILFTVYLEAVGDPIQETNIEFTADPVLQDAVDGDENELSPIYNGSAVLIVEPVSTFEPVKADFLVEEAYPNPFSTGTTINFSLARRMAVSWVITDVAGKEVAQSHQTLTAGSHQLVMDRNTLKRPGTYILQMQAGNDIITKRLFFIE